MDPAPLDFAYIKIEARQGCSAGTVFHVIAYRPVGSGDRNSYVLQKDGSWEAVPEWEILGEPTFSILGQTGRALGSLLDEAAMAVGTSGYLQASLGVEID